MKKFLKNRIILGLICIVVSLLISLVTHDCRYP